MRSRVEMAMNPDTGSGLTWNQVRHLGSGEITSYCTFPASWLFKALPHHFLMKRPASDPHYCNFKGTNLGNRGEGERPSQIAKKML